MGSVTVNAPADLPLSVLTARDSAADHHLITRLLAQVGMGWAAGRYFASLSGGEKQRVLLAKALAQQTDHVVVMDHGTIAAAGPPEDVLTETLIREVFGVRAYCGVHPVTGELHVAVHTGRRAAHPPSPATGRSGGESR